MKIFLALVFAISFALFNFASNIHGQPPSQIDTSFAPVIEGFTGTVTAIAKQPDGKVLVGGYFLSANGVDRFGLARFNADGSPDNSFSAPLGLYPTGIRAIVVQPDGKILVGGFFVTASNPFASKNIARLHPNGSEDTSFTGYTNSAVYAVALQSDGKILIGGAFTSVNGQSRFGTARLNVNGTTDTTFSYTIRTTYSIVIQPDGNILIGGNFVNTPPNTPSCIVRVSPTGAVDSAFISNASANGSVRTMKVESDGKILLGGSFSIVNGTFRNTLARLNADGTIDPSFSPSITASTITSVDSLDLDLNGKILIGGEFSGVNGTSRRNIARLHSDGTLDTAFAPQNGTNLPVRSVLPESDGGILIGGDFQIFNNLPKYRIARLNSDGSLNQSFNGSIHSNGTVFDVEIQPDGKIIAAGNFFYVNGNAVGSVARFNSDGTLDSSFVISQISGDPIYDIEIQPDGKILLIGTIYVGAAQNPSAVVRLNSNGSIDGSFMQPSSTGVATKGKIQSDGKILVGGTLSSIAGVTRTKLARLNSNGSVDSGFNPSITGQSTAEIEDIIVKSDGKIIIAGYFTSVNGSAKNSIARLNSDGTTDTSFTANASTSVNSITPLPDSSILATGFFTSVNGTTVNRIAKLLPDGQLDPGFNVDPGLTVPYVVIKPYTDGRIIVAGQGIYSNSLPSNVVILNANGSTNVVLSNAQWFRGNVYDVEVGGNGKVIFGGSFSRIAGELRFGLARFNSIDFTSNVNRPVFDFDGDSKSDVSIFRPSVGEWWYLRSSDGGNGAVQFGNSSDRLVPADYTGDGKTDVAIWRPSTGEWFILRSEDGSFYSFPFGAAGDIPAPGDFDGDGKSDAAIFRSSTSTWFILKSTGGTDIRTFGADGDLPVIGDYDSDGKSDLAIFRPSNGQWWINRSSSGTTTAISFGTSTDKTTPGDFTGDGKTDVAFFRPTSGEWFILRSEDSSFYSFPFGQTGDLPAAGDYDGDGKMDAAVFRPSNNTWYMLRSTAGFQAVGFGVNGDIPVPGAFVR
ncbi:MAG: VCBS repeat-containing protein [Pyrinomonadaceae bacterium]|nr:VCBS repeat-containing protein [Pyrinomonadaceae bacterium]